MTAWPESRGGGGLVAVVLAKAESWLLEPPPAAGVTAAPPSPPRPVVAVRGLSAGCGCSTVARALAVALAVDDPTGAAALVGGTDGARPRLAGAAAARLARELAELGCRGVHASGRLCLIPGGATGEVVALHRPCPLVIDVSADSPPAEALGLADRVVLVAAAADEPSLAAAVEDSLVRAGHRVEVVINRVAELERAPVEPVGAIAIGESRLAAQVALACRGARGPFARPIAELADRCRARAAG